MALPQSVRDSDRTVAAFVSLTQPEAAASPRPMVVCTDSRFCTLNWEKAGYYCPACPVCLPTPFGLVDFAHRIEIARRTSPRGRMPCRPTSSGSGGFSGAAPRRTRSAQSFPKTSLVLESGPNAFFLSEIDVRPLDATVPWGDMLCWFSRDLAAELAAGFGHVETGPAGQPAVWALGPKCGLRVGTSRSTSLRLILNVVQNPFPTSRSAFRATDSRGRPSSECHPAGRSSRRGPRRQASTAWNSPSRSGTGRLPASPQATLAPWPSTCGRSP